MIARALEQVRVFLGAEVLELQVVLAEAHARLHAARSARNSLISGQRMATICVGLVAVQDQRRQQADDALGGDADHQAGLGGAAEQDAAGPVELDAEHQALAAHLDDAGDAGELALEAGLERARRPRRRWRAGLLLP